VTSRARHRAYQANAVGADPDRAHLTVRTVVKPARDTVPPPSTLGPRQFH
jgi:hypothetical protein